MTIIAMVTGVRIRILVALRYERFLQFPEPKLEEGGRDVGVSEAVRWGKPLVHVKQQTIDLVYITRNSRG